ncbi:TorF family putative porin [Paraurantiacibacter namhicola]|uniref:Porin domain-containing protein n=1 Tax=Paraurantiacibacter namhicola TaxID=645517 RepID=A0A1C7DB18_9SPHN|nr:TorF family putative porin [Paraurantiacibacter namhicola]ANU08644.1 hypothetical protein A6F65_02361 [Paraurantiacibacter namhicola]
MLTSIRSAFAATLLAGSVFVAAPAAAQDGVTISGNASIVSDYRFRGVSLSGGDPAIQGGIDVETGSGFYVGTWGSSIDGGPLFGEMELDVYGGWSGEVSPGISVNVGAIAYLFPTNDFGPADYGEVYASVSPSIGPAELTVGAAYAWDQDALGNDDNLYLYSDLSVGVPTTPLTFNAHLGYTDGALAPDFLAGGLDDSGLDWSLGVSATLLGSLEVGVAYVGVEGTSVDGFTDDTVVATVGVSF